jgi:DNA repair protein RecO (recombination protein O)
MEPLAPPFLLQGDAIFSGLYLNELIVRLLQPDDPHPAVFQQYSSTLLNLSANNNVELSLRDFEWVLLSELGYGFSLTVDSKGRPIQPNGHYHFIPDEGLESVDQFQPGAFKGEELLALSNAEWGKDGALKAAKRLMRQAYAPLLHGKPLISRELFLK